MTKIKRALISVSDKTNLDKVISYLDKNQIDIISTGGTCKKITELTHNVVEVSTYTGFPEIMNGRVKTLNPYIYGGILANRDNIAHQQDLQNNNINLIDLIIVNLYPFEEIVSRETTDHEAIENIDIGGPTMVRAAAKNYEHVVIITDPEDYDELINELQQHNNTTTLEFRKKMAIKAFSRTFNYDQAIYNWFTKETNDDKLETLQINAKLKQKLRYGENPHQEAKLYIQDNIGICGAKQIQGKELSYNNIADGDSALRLIQEFDSPAVAIIKHANPCGMACDSNIAKAFSKALLCDPVSSFGGIIALNREVDQETANLIKQTFFEVVIAPGINQDASKILSNKKNMRVLITNISNNTNNLEIKSIEGGILVQSKDDLVVTNKDFHCPTVRKPNSSEEKDLLFAFKAIKHVRSNAILFAKDSMSIAIGAGQMSRVDSVRIACTKLNDFVNNNKDFSKKDLVLASDAFFPFADGVELAAKAGITAIIQPGGSIRDDEVIKKADEYNIAMIFTKIRHFKH